MKELLISNKLTDWSNEPKVSDLKADLVASRSFYDIQITKVNIWLDNLFVTGSAQQKKKKGRSSLVPKLIRKHAEWRYPSLSEAFLSKYELFDVSPVTYEDKKSAIQNALILNNQINTKLSKTAFIDDMVRSLVDEGTCIIRVGWEYEEEIEVVTVPLFEYTVDPSANKMHKQLQQLLISDKERYLTEIPEHMQKAHQISMETGQSIIPIQIGVKEQEQLKVIKNQPTIDIVDYTSIYIDPTAKGKLDKAQFLIYEFETSLSDLKKTGRYENLDELVNAGSGLHSTNNYYNINSNNFNFQDEPRKKVTAYEYWGYWDINGTGKTTAIKCTWVNDTIIELIENPFPDKKIPFIFIPYLPVRNSFFGEPDGELLEDNQKISGAVTRGMLDLLGRSANGQTTIPKDLFDSTNLRKYNNGEDCEHNPGSNPANIHQFKFPEIPQSAQYMLNLQGREAEALSGIKAFNDGITGDSLGSSVGGQRNALDASGKRETSIVRRLAEGLIGVGRKIISMNAVWLSEEEVIRVTNEEFVTIRRDDLEGNFDLKLSISTLEADAQKAQELAFLLQTTGQVMGIEFSQLILTEIAKLRKMPDLAKRIEKFKPASDPIENKRKQLEIELFKAQIENELAKARENRANGMMDEAKTQEILANTALIKSSKDQKDLDYIEQESGVKHQREVDRLQSQARGNIALKAMDHESKIQQEQIKQQVK